MGKSYFELLHSLKDVTFGHAFDFKMCGEDEKCVSIWIIRFFDPNKNTSISVQRDFSTPRGSDILSFVDEERHSTVQDVLVRQHNSLQSSK